jgi:hypothetical protein
MEIAAEVAGQRQLSPTQRVAVGEVARSMAVLEALERGLDDNGVVDKRGKASYLLEARTRESRLLERWLSRLEQADKQQLAPKQIQAGFSDYRNELQRIALGYDYSATTRDRLAALGELMKLGRLGTSDGPAPKPFSPEVQQRLARIQEAQAERALEILEDGCGLRPYDIPPYDYEHSEG